MRLRNFLIIIGLWVALLSHLGLSISAENVLFSITGFVLIVSSFYVAAIEDKHKHTRVIKGETLEATNEKINSLMSHLKTIKKNTLDRVGTQKPKQEQPTKPKPSQIKQIKTVPEFPLPQSEDEDDSVVVVEEDDGRPRIRKAVSDVKIKADSVDDIVS